MLPRNALLSTKCDLLQTSLEWCAGDAAQEYLLHPKAVGRAKHRSDVIETPYVVQNKYYFALLRHIIWTRLDKRATLHLL